MIFTDTDSAVREYPDLVREYFATIIPPTDNKFAALNSAVWSGGSFIYVPKGVKIDFPLQAYFRINSENMGQFERTLIIVDEGAQVHYVEGCTAPMYTHRKPALGRRRDHRQEARPLPLHDDSELVEQHLQPGHQAGHGLRRLADGMDRRQPRQPADDEVSGHLHDGAGRSRRNPVDRLCRQGQHQDAGAKMVHCAPHTSSRIISKSISKNGGRASYRGLVKVEKRRRSTRSRTSSATRLILDPDSRSDTYPYIEIDEHDVTIGHEASVSRIGEEQLFYLHQPRPVGGRSQHDDRHRLHRAARQRAADGIRRRDEPAHRIADGRLGGIVDDEHCGQPAGFTSASFEAFSNRAMSRPG